MSSNLADSREGETAPIGARAREYPIGARVKVQQVQRVQKYFKSRIHKYIMGKVAIMEVLHTSNTSTNNNTKQIR